MMRAVLALLVVSCVADEVVTQADAAEVVTQTDATPVSHCDRLARLPIVGNANEHGRFADSGTFASVTPDAKLWIPLEWPAGKSLTVVDVRLHDGPQFAETRVGLWRSVDGVRERLRGRVTAGTLEPHTVRFQGSWGAPVLAGDGYFVLITFDVAAPSYIYGVAMTVCDQGVGP